MLDSKKASLIYKSISLSMINYGIELYDKENSKWIIQLQKTQNRLLKILFKKDKLYRTNKIHKDSKILKINDLAQARLLLIIHKFVYHKKSLNWAHRNIVSNPSTLYRSTRNSLNVQLTASAYTKRNTIIEKASVTWNNLDQVSKSIPNRDKFKKAIENKTINTYL